MNTDIIIIGSGLFGSMTAKYMKSKGLSVIIIDNKEELSASKCSFGVWKEGWINESIKDKVNISLPILDEFIGIQEIDYFNLDKNIQDKMFKIDCNKILNEKIDIVAKVVQINNNIVKYQKNSFKMNDFERIKANKAVIICAGVWTEAILRQSGYSEYVQHTDVQYGATMDFNMNIDMSRIKTIAPYKQSVIVKMSENKFVFGDGSTVKNPIKEDKRLKKVGDRMIQRAIDLIGSSSAINYITSVKEGYRPYLSKGNYEFVNKHDSNLFSATGGAKNSTILCGYVADKLYNMIKNG